ncbi:MAG: HD domain-containing protein [Bacillota bacterium]
MKTLTNENGLAAFDSHKSLGRRSPASTPGDPFVQDILTITNSKIFIRLARKTQVFNPYLPVANRLTHTLQVMAVATELSARLKLNTPLVQAASLLHDCGHTVISHLGEQTLSALTGKNFRHEIMSVNLAIASGLNLSYETLKAAYLHSRGDKRMETRGGPEDNIVMFADKLAYVFTDIEDALKMKVIDEESINKVKGFLDQRACIEAMIKESLKQGEVSFQFSEEAKIFSDLKDMMHVIYKRVDLTEGRQKQKVEMIELFEHLGAYREYLKVDPVLAIALMNDQEMHDSFLIMQRPNIGSFEAIGNMPWKELHDEFIGIKIFEPDLSPDDFLRG